MLSHTQPGRHRAASSARHAAPAAPLRVSAGLHRGHHRPRTPMLRPSVVAVATAIAMILGLTGTAVGAAQASDQVSVTMLPVVSPGPAHVQPAPATSVTLRSPR
jgi:hypothetical protein